VGRKGGGTVPAGKIERLGRAPSRSDGTDKTLPIACHTGRVADYSNRTYAFHGLKKRLPAAITNVFQVLLFQSPNFLHLKFYPASNLFQILIKDNQNAYVISANHSKNLNTRFRKYYTYFECATAGSTYFGYFSR